MFGLAKSAANAGDHALKSAQKTGLTVEAYQRLAYAAELADVSSEQLDIGMFKLSKSLADAAEGGKDTSQAFKKLGVNVKDSSGKLISGEEALIKIADAAAKMPDGTEKIALLSQVLGKSAQTYIPLINGGGQAIRELGDELEAFGGVITGDVAKASEEMNDNLTRIFGRRGVVASVKNAIGAQLIPLIRDLTASFLNWAKANREVIRQKIKEWADNLRKALVYLIEKGKQVLKWVDAFVKKMGGLDKVLSLVGKLFLAFIAAKVIYGLYAVATAIGTITAALLAMDAAAIVPLLIVAAILAIAAAVYLVYDDIKAWIDGRPNLFGKFYDWAVKVKDELVEVWEEFRIYWDDFWLVFQHDLWPIMQRVGEMLVWPYKITLKAIEKVADAHNALIDKLSSIPGYGALKNAKIDTEVFKNAFKLPDLEGLSDLVKLSRLPISAEANKIRLEQLGATRQNPMGMLSGLGVPVQALSGAARVEKKQDNKFSVTQSVTVNATTSADPAQIGDAVKNVTKSFWDNALRSASKTVEGLF